MLIQRPFPGIFLTGPCSEQSIMLATEIWAPVLRTRNARGLRFCEGRVSLV